MKVHFVTSQRGKRMIEVDGWTYSLRESKGVRKKWRCSTRSHAGCHAHVLTLHDDLVAVVGEHTHSPNRRKKQI
uniref:SFRICE_004214 n=1 Tax=Spodoptera frugiperda TaxID=7108 RepID=A0A2H1VGM6_SPOFR